MKRLVALGLVIALVLTLALPLAVSATSISGQVLSQPTITHVYLHGTTTPASGLITASTPSSPIALDIEGTNFDTTSGDPVPAVTTSATAGAITVSAVSVSSSTLLYATFVVAAGTISGNYDVMVTQGGRTSSTSSADYFLVKSYGTVSAPSDISLGLMSIGIPATANGAGSIVTNDASWTVSVKDSTNTANAGHMSISGTGTGILGTNVLTEPFLISKDNVPADYAAANLGISLTGTYSSSGSALPMYVSQTVDSNDGAGSYSITITFTFSPKY